MKPRHQASRAALDLIERFEGYRRSAARLDDGRWTVGYGHTRTARQGAEVSQSDAEALLIYDLMEITAKLNEWVHTPLTQNQFDALTAFVFNIGIENFRSSSVLRRINEGQLLQAACAMEMWRRADFEGERIVIDALVRRRAAEKALFLTPTNGFLPAPTPILTPRLDGEIANAAPAHKPVEVSVALNGERATAERIGSLEDYHPMPPMADEIPMASEAAAEAVISRLRAIPAEEPAGEVLTEARIAPEPEPEPEPELQPEAGPEPELEPEPEQSFALTPPPAEPEPGPFQPYGATSLGAGQAAEEEAPLFPAEPLGFDEYDSQRVAHHEFDSISELDEAPLERIQGLNPVLMWFGVAIVGLIVFAAGIFWMFSARQAASGGLFSFHVVIGLVLGVLGIGCVATAVYFLLERLGGREEQ